MPRVDGPYDIEAVKREWIGHSQGRGALGRFPVEYDPIRRFCRMVRDTNPLFLDPEYAKDGPYGEVIVPLPFVTSFSGGPPPRPPSGEAPAPRGFSAMMIPTPGDRYINMGVGYEYLKPVRVGDRLASETVITDIFMKPIRLDPKAVWVVTENRITNEDGELVAIWRNTMLSHRTPEEVEADPETAALRGQSTQPRSG